MRRLPYIALLLVVQVGPSTAAANEGGASLFVRGDTDRTVVVTPRVHARAVLDDERTSVDAAYAADIWTAASIDIRTAATRAVTEQRDELNLAVAHELDDVTIGGSYYYSGENDYWSHGFALRSVQELFGNSTTLEESIRYSHDIVGRAGDPSFQRPVDSFGLRAVFTQVLTADVIVQGVWEGSYRMGFQSSPYRFVGVDALGDTDGNGLCSGTAVLCLPEAHPAVRIRNALVARGRFALAREGQRTLASAGLGYRFYFDDWGIYSHTGVAQIAWAPATGQILTVRYRFYTQTAASFYFRRYQMRGQIVFITRDRELSPMFSNRLALSYQGRMNLSEGVDLKLSMAVGGTLFAYADFEGLDEVYALDGTLAATLVFD